MTSLYEQLSSREDGRSLLAGARLRNCVMFMLEDALQRSGMSKSELAKRLGVRKSAVSAVFAGNGNLQMNTVAEYLAALGFEMNPQMVLAGEIEASTVELRLPEPIAHQSQSLAGQMTRTRGVKITGAVDESKHFVGRDRRMSAQSFLSQASARAQEDVSQ